MAILGPATQVNSATPTLNAAMELAQPQQVGGLAQMAQAAPRRGKSSGGGKKGKGWEFFDLDKEWEKNLLNIGLRLLASPGGMSFGQELGHAGIGALGDYQRMMEQRRRDAAQGAQDSRWNQEFELRRYSEPVQMSDGSFRVYDKVNRTWSPVEGGDGMTPLKQLGAREVSSLYRDDPQKAIELLRQQGYSGLPDVEEQSVDGQPD